jgi:hypothetical protein
MRAKQENFKEEDEEWIPTKEDIKQCDAQFKKRWTFEEECRYLDFVEENKEILSRKAQPRDKIYKNMEEVVGRERVLCFSHHKNALRHYGNLEGILKNKRKDIMKKEKVDVEA